MPAMLCDCCPRGMPGMHWGMPASGPCLALAVLWAAANLRCAEVPRVRRGNFGLIAILPDGLVQIPPLLEQELR